MGATNTLDFCLNQQTAIDKVLGAGDPLGKSQETLGASIAVKSAENTQGFEAIQNAVQSPKARPTSTSNRKVTVYGRVKSCPTVVTTKPDGCTPVSAQTTDLIDEEVIVENYNGFQYTLDDTVYQDTCNGSTDMVAAYKLMEAVESIKKAENNELIDAMIADADAYFDGDASTVNGGTEKTVNLYSTAGIPQPGNIFRLREEYRRKGYGALAPIILGGTILQRWIQDRGLFANNVDGADISKLAELPSYVDYELDTIAQAVGPNTDLRLFSWIPGHVQFLTYLDFAAGSPLSRNRPTYTATTINVGGELFDYEVSSPDCGDHTITVGRHSAPWIPDTQWFDAACGGQESLLSWLSDCVDTTCADVQLT